MAQSIAMLEETRNGCFVLQKVRVCAKKIAVWCDEDIQQSQFVPHGSSPNIQLHRRTFDAANPKEAAVLVAHELIHCWHWLENPREYERRAGYKDEAWNSAEEYYTIVGYDSSDAKNKHFSAVTENMIRRELALPDRTKY